MHENYLKNHILITDLEVGQQITGCYLLKNQENKITKTNKPYVLMTFADKSNTIQGNLWDTTIELTNIPDQSIVKISATIGEYNGKKQLNQLKIESIVTDIEPSFFQESIPERPGELVNELMDYVNQINNSIWSAITTTILREIWDDFVISPAAKSVHHALKHGLLYHTVCMLRLTDAICNIYPNLNRELMFAAITLHDMGKTIELEGIDNINYTTRGTLIGHISLIDQKISVVANNIGIHPDNEDLLLLHHCVLSHHGLLAYGSPVMPLIKEAEIIHMIDNIDAKMMQLTTALSRTKPGQFTDRMFAMDNRSFYKPLWEN